MSSCTLIHHAEIYRRQGNSQAGLQTTAYGPGVMKPFACSRPDASAHPAPIFILRTRAIPSTPMQARSHDGGRTWKIEAFNGFVPGRGTLSADEHVDDQLKSGNGIVPSRDLRPLVKPFDFPDTEFIILAARTGLTGCPTSWFYVRRDRAHSWEGPFRFEGLELAGGIAARTDIVALGRHDALFMLTTTKDDGGEGRVFCARTTGGARTFRSQSYLWDGEEGYCRQPGPGPTRSRPARDGFAYLVCMRGGNVSLYRQLGQTAQSALCLCAPACMGRHSASDFFVHFLASELAPERPEHAPPLS